MSKHCVTGLFSGLIWLAAMSAVVVSAAEPADVAPPATVGGQALARVLDRVEAGLSEVATIRAAFVQEKHKPAQ